MLQVFAAFIMFLCFICM